DAGLEGGLFLVVELDLDHLLDALAPQHAGDAHEVAVDAVLPVAVGGAGEDALLVADDRLRHLHAGARRGVVGAAGLPPAHARRAPLPRAVDDLLEPLRGDELRHGDPAGEGVAGEGNHVVPVPAQQQGLHALHAAPDLLGEEGAVAGGVEHARLADDLARREAAGLPGDVDHRIQRGGDDDLGGGGGVRGDLLGDAADDLGVLGDEVVAAHARLARQAGGDDDVVAPLGRLVAGGAGDAGVEP